MGPLEAEELSRVEFEEAVTEAYTRQKKDVEAVVNEIMGRSEEELRTMESPVYYFDAKYKKQEPEAMAGGALRIGPKFFELSKSKQIRYLRSVLTQARREARMSESLAKQIEREKYRQKWRQHKVREQVNKRIEQLKKLKNREWYAKIPNDLRRPIDEILEGIDLRGMRKGYREELAGILDWLESEPLKDQVELSDHTKRELRRLEQQNIRDMTPEQVEALYQTVMHYALLAADWNQIRIEEQRSKLEEAVDKAIKEFRPPRELHESSIRSDNRPMTEAIEQTKDFLDRFFGIGQEHYDLFVEKVAGPTGVVNRVFGLAIESARTVQLRYEQEIHDLFIKATEDLGITSRNAAGWFNERVQVGKLDLTRAERIALYMHSQNEDNWDSIVEAGFGFRHKKGYTNVVYNAGVDFNAGDLDHVLADLSDQELGVARALRELDDKMGEDLAAIFVEVNGYELPMVENHWHKDVMPIGRGSEAQEAGIKEMAEATMLRPGVPKGWLKERRDVTVPLYLNSAVYDLVVAAERASAYVGFEKPMRQASKLLYHIRFKEALIKRYGERVWQEIRKGLKDVVGEQTANDDVSRILNKMRKAMTTAWIAGNPFTPLKQPLQLANAARYVQPGYLAHGVWKATSDPVGQRELHKLYSPKFRDRLERGFTRDIAEFNKLRQSRAWERRRVTARKIVMSGVVFMDAQTVTAVMSGAVAQVLGDKKNGELSAEVARALNINAEKFLKLDADQLLQKAYQFADYVVARTQDMSLPEHRSPLQRGGALARALTMFGASTNQNWNLIKRSLIETVREKNPRARRAAVYAILSIFVIQPLAEAGVDYLRRRMMRPKEPPEKNEYLWEVLESIAGTWILLRDMFRVVESAIRRRWDAEFQLASSGALRVFSKMINDGFRAATEVNRLRRERYLYRFFDGLMDTILIWAEIPLYAPKAMLRSWLKAKGRWPYHLR
jgi:hypothetical protein